MAAVEPVTYVRAHVSCFFTVFRCPLSRSWAMLTVALGRPSTVVKAQEKLASLTDDPTPSTRRNSVWSMTSNGERRASLSSLKNMFRRGSTTEEPEVEKIEE